MTRVHMGGLVFDTLRLLRHLGVLGMTLAAQDFDGCRLLFAGSYLLVGGWGVFMGGDMTPGSCYAVLACSWVAPRQQRFHAL